jgi:hypothetical protein
MPPTQRKASSGRSDGSTRKANAAMFNVTKIATSANHRKMRAPIRFRLSTGPTQPMAPSIWSSMRRFSSTAYSMGSSRVIGSMNPFTIIAVASASVRPRLIR